MQRPTLVQFNLSPTLGGAEVYSVSFSRALLARGWRTRLIVDPGATFWNDLDLGNVRRDAWNRHAGSLLEPGDLAIVHAPLASSILDALRGRYLVGVAHQALYDATRPAYYDRADVLLAVSRHVISSLQRHGLTRVHATPLYGVADLHRGPPLDSPIAGPLFDADARKLRDRMLGVLGGLRRTVTAAQPYHRRSGLSLGVVSRLAPLKQFPLLFQHLTPVLERHPGVNVEIFGAAVGYKPLAALRSVLKPLGKRVRFWGRQRDVAAAYRAFDYLLAGLPEREALGLNAIESCCAGTPVLAIAAPPFSETMKDGVTGFLYADPREDGGADFDRVLTGIETGELRADMAAAAAHLERFSFERFADRIDAVMEDVAARAA